MTRLSIVIAVLESYEVVRRMIHYFKGMKLPDDIEILFIDDGSTPPIRMEIFDDIKSLRDLPGTKNVSIFCSHDPRPWSQPCARNLGATLAVGEHLLMTDIDHILSKEAVLAAAEGGYDKMIFPRFWAVLTKRGEVSQDEEELFGYGLPRPLYKERGLHGGHHSNTFAMRTVVFNRLGGYDPRYCGRYGGDDVDFSKRYGYLCRVLEEVTPAVSGPPIYVYPDPRGDVKRVFHQTRRKLGRVERDDPVCPDCGKVYQKCFCYYPKKEV